MELSAPLFTFTVLPTVPTFISLTHFFRRIVLVLVLTMFATPTVSAEEPAKGTPTPPKQTAETDAQGSRQKEAEETERLTELF